MKLLKTTALIAAIMTPLSLSTPAYADKDPVYTPLRHSLALGGYDTVSYFSGKPMKGDKRFATEYMGATWRFASEANLDLFNANPAAFTPQYGGYCAWAIAHGKLAKGSPKHWLIEDGKFYVNFNARIQKQWTADKDAFITEADARWPDILKD